MFKDILLPVVMGEIHAAAVAQACALATAHAGHVAALASVSLASPIASAWSYYPEGVYETMDEVARATTRKLAETIEPELERLDVSYEVRQANAFWLTTAELCALHARYADLTVFGVGRPVQEPERAIFAGLLAGSGRPLLMVPPSTVVAEHFRRVVIAWKPSAQASRALHDALPILQRASAVHVLMVETESPAAAISDDIEDDDDGEARTAGAGGMWGPHGNGVMERQLIAHLARQGVPATLVHRAVAHANAGRAIIDYAREQDADLIVAGGYSHARALEQVFGGVTRTLLESASIPVLFSH